jgi:G6PDH family F420-dependent oxidoreductase
MRIGYFLGSEDHSPTELVDIAQRAHDAGFEDFWISDHFHPWTDRQGESPFVWSVIGAIAGRLPGVRITTAVTCPTFRIHPAILAQAAATSACLLDGRFVLGIGTGENLNEHVLGQHWPPTGVRLERLEEAVEVMRRLWTGEIVNHRGEHFTVERARIYSLPDEPPPIFMSAFGKLAAETAGRIADGFMTTKPDAETLGVYRAAGGTGIAQAGMKGCFASSEEDGAKLAFEIWPTSAVSGELSQELPMPAHFEQACELVTPEMLAERLPCGPDPERWVSAATDYADAGIDELYVSQIGPDIEGFLRFWTNEVAPALPGSHELEKGPTAPNDDTMRAERETDGTTAHADREPTAEEEAAAPSGPVDRDVAASYEAAMDRGANVKGEGQIE